MADVSLSKHRINRIVPALTVVCPALALAGQWALDRLSTPLWGGVLLVLAAASFVAIWEGHPIERDSGAVGVARNIPRAPVVAAVVLGILSFFRLGGNRYSLNGTLLWLGGLICLAAAAYTGPLQLRARLSMLRRDGLYLGWHLVALLGIMALGAFYRLFRIHLIPLEMGCDLPHNYFNIAAILRGEFPVFFPSFPGREGLFFYLASIPSAIFGLSHTTIKATSALVGVATLPAIYALGRELYDREVGLLAAFFMAVGHWHVIMTRVGYRNSMVPLMLTLTWYFAARGLRTGRREAFALSGLCLGLGLHTYNAFMIVPLAVALLIVGEIVVGRGERLRANLANVALLGLVALYLFIPLGRYAYDAPGSYGYRAATRLTDAEVALPSNLALTFAGNVIRSLLMFNYRGDGVFIANVPFVRQLGLVAGAFFVPGVAWLVWRWRRGRNLQMLTMLGVMLLPAALALAFPNEVPSAIRAIGALPAAVLVSAVALAIVWREVTGQLAGHRVGMVLAAGALVTALTYEAVATYPLYFRDYVAHQPDGNYSISLAIAKAICDFGDSGDAYIIVWPHWYDGNAVQAQLGRENPDWDNDLYDLHPDGPPFQGDPGAFMVIVHPEDEASLDTLRREFPKGVAIPQHKFDGSIAFITFYGER